MQDRMSEKPFKYLCLEDRKVDSRRSLLLCAFVTAFVGARNKLSQPPFVLKLVRQITNEHICTSCTRIDPFDKICYEIWPNERS
jgi:hypothetical protein